MRWFVTFFLLLQESVENGEHEVEWSYHGGNGPRQWCSKFDACCGRSQSPLNLHFSKHLITLQGTHQFTFTDYDIPLRTVSLLNTGHTVVLQSSENVKPKVSGGMLNKTYVFEQIHFHWGSSDVVGSEHAIEGKRYPLEMHIVHYSDEYNSLTEATHSNTPDALKVIAILYNIESFSNTKLSLITDNLESIRFLNEKIQLQTSLQLSKLLPQETSQFFRYHGSLTTPGCSEVVTWTVFGVPSFVSKHQMTQFRRVLASGKGDELPQEMFDNYRPLQEENGREIDVYSE